jgi:hypothetical protein
MVSIVVEKSFDGTSVAQQRLLKLLKARVLAGVTEATSGQDVAEGEINNAQKAYINDQGAPEINVPQREFMRPGIERNRDKIIAGLTKAGRGILAEDTRLVAAGFDSAGLAAQKGIQDEIQSGDLQSAGRTLAPKTLANRRARGRTGEEPLQDTGAMIGSITYVIEGLGNANN